MEIASSEFRAEGLPTITLPEHVFTRSRASVNPQLDVWQWSDGPAIGHLSFDRLPAEAKHLKLPLKQVLVAYLRGHSSHYIENLFEAFLHLFARVPAPADGKITAQYVSDYAASLELKERWRVGVLNGLLQKWVKLRLPGVTPECASYLREQRKPGNTKGEAVRTLDPVKGPLCEEEYNALYSAVNAAYGSGEFPLWALLLTRLFLACGGRVSQYASMKVCDFDIDTRVLRLPQAKTGYEHTRISFLDFDISPQTAALMAEYFEELSQYDDDWREGPLFPVEVVMPRGPRVRKHSEGDLFFRHCLPSILGERITNLLEDIAPPTSRLDNAPLPVNTQRFRYTFGTRMAEEGASEMLIANRFGHVDLQQVKVYVAASAKIVKNYDAALSKLLAPLAMAFKGRIVESEDSSTLGGAPGSRIRDFRVSSEGLGSCAGQGKQCGFNKPVACYSCFRFEPWLDAPHEKVLLRLEADRTRWSDDERMAAVNDEPIRAVREVIALCAEIWSKRDKAETKVKTA